MSIAKMGFGVATAVVLFFVLKWAFNMMISLLVTLGIIAFAFFTIRMLLK